MKTLSFVLLLPLFVDSKPSFGLPEIKVHQDKSINGIPSIDIKFPNGHEDSFVLERHYMSEEDKLAKKMHCNFIGAYFENELLLKKINFTKNVYTNDVGQKKGQNGQNFAFVK